MQKIYPKEIVCKYTSSFQASGIIQKVMHSLINGTSIQITFKVQISRSEMPKGGNTRVILLNQKCCIGFSHCSMSVWGLREALFSRAFSVALVERHQEPGDYFFFRNNTCIFAGLGVTDICWTEKHLVSNAGATKCGLEYIYTAVKFNQYYSTAAWIFVAWILIFKYTNYIYFLK